MSRADGVYLAGLPYSIDHALYYAAHKEADFNKHNAIAVEVHAYPAPRTKVCHCQ